MPTAGRVVVRPIEGPNLVRGVYRTSRPTPREAIVVESSEPWLPVGSIAVIPPWSGIKIKCDDIELLIVGTSDIQGYIEASDAAD